ncbi:MAG: BRCT domain-containing protein [Bacillota bacterium]
MSRLEDYELMNYRKYTFKSEMDKALRTLEGILDGITIDNCVNISELKELRHWCDYYRNFIYKHPFNEILPIIQDAMKDNILDQEEIKDIIWACRKYQSSLFYYIVTSDIQKLHGILHGILSDNTISKEEIIGLSNWLDENSHLATVYPYDEICSLVTHVLADGIVDDGEKKILKAFFSEFVDLKQSETINLEEINEIKNIITINGICAVTPEIIVPDKVFCFTGVSSRGKRHVIADTVESLGGIFKNSVTLSTDYLVVGDNGNPCWCFSCYGRKVEKAMELRKSGHKILIVHENDFWDALEDMAL